MHDERLYDRLAYDFTGGPDFNTQISAVLSGREARNRNRDPIWRWSGSYDGKTKEEMDSVRNHFLAVSGRHETFPFKDWMDYSVTLAEGRATALTSTTFQLQKAYASGSRTTLRKVVMPVATGFEVRVSGSPLSGGSYSLDTSTGIITIGAAPSASAITWAGEFYCLVRYDTDRMAARIVNRNQSTGFIHTWDAVDLVERSDEAE